MAVHDINNWLRFPYGKKPYADSTLYQKKKSELVQIIRDYEHNYSVLYEANERGIRAATKMLDGTDKVAEWKYKTMSVPGGKGQTYSKWSCTHCKTKRKDRTKFCPECGYKMKNGGPADGV